MKLRTFLQEQESLLEADANVSGDVEETSDQASVRSVRPAFARVIFIPDWQFRLARDNNRITLELRLLTLSVCYVVQCVHMINKVVGSKIFQIVCIVCVLHSDTVVMGWVLHMHDTCVVLSGCAGADPSQHCIFNDRSRLFSGGLLLLQDPGMPRFKDFG